LQIFKGVTDKVVLLIVVATSEKSTVIELVPCPLTITAPFWATQLYMVTPVTAGTEKVC
jgi:hypothetical protein